MPLASPAFADRFFITVLPGKSMPLDIIEMSVDIIERFKNKIGTTKSKVKSSP